MLCSLVSGNILTRLSLSLGYLTCNSVLQKVIFLFRYCVKNQTGYNCMLIIDLYSFFCGLANMELTDSAHMFSFINFRNYGCNVLPMD
jgi:hypothetical protein